MTLIATLPLVPVAPDLAARLAAVSQQVREAPVGERNRLIREAYDTGGGVREIARIVGITHQAVRLILDRTPGNDEESPAERP